MSKEWGGFHVTHYAHSLHHWFNQYWNTVTVVKYGD